MTSLSISCVWLFSVGVSGFYPGRTIQDFRRASSTPWSPFLSSPCLPPSIPSTLIRATVEKINGKDHGTQGGDDDEEDIFLQDVDASSLRSVTFTNVGKDQEPQLLCNLLMELGACSTSIIDADKGTNNEEAIFDEFDETSMTRTAVTTHVWNTCHISAHFPASTSLEWIMDIVHDTFPNLPTYSHVEKVEDKDWVLHVQQSWKPIVSPPFVLRFPWHSDDTVRESVEQYNSSSSSSSTTTTTPDRTTADDNSELNDFVELELQGGIAFGTGEHPTTKLCLGFVSDVIHPGMKLMDYGSGSGVLGMAACKLDPTVTSIGVDIDVDAVQIANQNARRNNVKMRNFLSDLVQTQGDDESTSLLLKAYSSNSKLQQREDEDDNASSWGVEVLPEEWKGPVFDACVANILAGPLVMLGPTIAGLLKEGSPLGLSGIMTSQSDMIIKDKVYQECFDSLEVKKELDGWVLITGVRNSKQMN